MVACSEHVAYPGRMQSFGMTDPEVNSKVDISKLKVKLYQNAVEK